jgi:hypothetical protein
MTEPPYPSTDLPLDPELAALVRSVFPVELEDPPVDLLEAGLRLIGDRGRAEVTTSGGALVVGLPSARSMVMAPRAAAAALGGMDDTIVLNADDRGLTTMWSRTEDGRLVVTISSDQRGDPRLFLVRWAVGRTDGDGPFSLATPLAPGAEGSSVSYDLGPVSLDELTLGEAVPLLDASLGGGPGLDAASPELEAAVRAAFATALYGMAVRAWRHYLDNHPSPTPVTELVRSLLAAYAN